MKLFKKLLLSATTICTMSGVMKSAEAFVFLKSHNTSEQQLANSANNFEHSEDVAFLMHNLKEIVSIQGQDARTLEAKRKERAQLLNYILQYREIRNNRQSLANSPQQIQDYTQQLRKEIVSLKEEIKQLRAHALTTLQEQLVRAKRDKSENDLESMTTQIKSLTDQITQLPEETIDISKVSAAEPIAWNKKNFIQIALGKRPDDLTSLTTDEMNLWRTFTMLTFVGSKNSSSIILSAIEPQDKTKMKIWSTWNGAFTTKELEEKFKANGFMTRAFQIKKAISFKEDITDENSEDIFTYFTNNKPEIKLGTESDLVKAYYFRGLYKVLTNSHIDKSSDHTEFKIDLDKGINGSSFLYAPQYMGKVKYETSLTEAEEFFENTPWHQLFINQVQQATLNKLIDHKTTIKKEFDKNFFKDTRSDYWTLKAKYDSDLDITNAKIGSIFKATSLREIDDALGLRS